MHHPSELIITSQPELKTVVTHIRLPWEPNHNSPDLEEVSIGKGTSGIKTIRNLQEWSSKRPVIESPKLAIIYGVEKLTTQGQNALLKILEEPPANTKIVLTTNNPNKLLPTITSRVITHIDQQVASKNEELVALARQFILGNFFDKSKLIEQLIKLDDRDAIAEWLTLILRASLTLVEKNQLSIEILDTIKQSILSVRSSGNLRLTLQTLAISMS